MLIAILKRDIPRKTSTLPANDPIVKKTESASTNSARGLSR